VAIGLYPFTEKVTERKPVDVSDSRPSPLGNRFDEVCRVRGITARAWSLQAGFSERYLAVQRNRSADDPSYVLPEKPAARLAAAVNISVDWLRFGRGSMEIPTPLPNPRLTLIHDTLRALGEMVTAGDLEGARIALQSLNRLLGVEPEVATSPSTVTSPSAARKAG
jgi:hypothetical protein